MPDTPDEAAEKTQKAIIEIVTRTYERASAYTNLVMLGGYAGAFAIWNFSREHLTAKAAACVALLLGTSLTLFVLFEIFKMIVMMRGVLKQRALLTAGLPPDQFLAELAAVRHDSDKAYLKTILVVWVVVLAITLTTAVGAIGLLFYNFVAILLKWPIWPS